MQKQTVNQIETEQFDDSDFEEDEEEELELDSDL